jgi:DEP domain-containing protein 5
VTQISDIRDSNAFQSCFPIRLAVPPPIVSDLDKRVPEGTQTAQYFEYALLRQFGYVLDVEAAWMYSEQIDVVYSYRRSSYQYSQFVHNSGAAFVQILQDAQGFLFLTNRLVSPSRVGPTMKTKDYRPIVADEIRKELHKFCSDEEALTKFYDEELEKLGHPIEEPPPLSI